MLRRVAMDLAEFYRRIAVELSSHRGEPMPPVPVPPSLDGAQAAGSTDERPGTDGPGTDGPGTEGPGDGADGAAPRHPHTLWVREQLQELVSHAPDLTTPAEHVAQLRRVPWWR